MHYNYVLDFLRIKCIVMACITHFSIRLLLCDGGLFVVFLLLFSVVIIHLFVWLVIYETALNHFSIALGIFVLEIS